MPSRDIFISYRRADTEDVTGRVYDRLLQKYGGDRLFYDVEAIPLGEDFTRVLTENLAVCKILIAIIGDDWLIVTSSPGETTPRLWNPADYVHVEIASALKRGIPLIPALVHGIKMPAAVELPEPLRGLSHRAGFSLRSDPHFNGDIDLLFHRLDDLLGPQRPITVSAEAQGALDPGFFYSLDSAIQLEKKSLKVYQSIQRTLVAVAIAIFVSGWIAGSPHFDFATGCSLVTLLASGIFIDRIFRQRHRIDTLRCLRIGCDSLDAEERTRALEGIQDYRNAVLRTPP